MSMAEFFRDALIGEQYSISFSDLSKQNF